MEGLGVSAILMAAATSCWMRYRTNSSVRASWETGGPCVFVETCGRIRGVSAGDEGARSDNCRIGTEHCLLCQAERVPVQKAHAQCSAAPPLMLTLSNETAFKCPSTHGGK